MKILICVQKEFASVIQFALEGYRRNFKLVWLEDTNDFKLGSVTEGEDFILILCSSCEKNMAEKAKAIKKKHPRTRILYLIDSETTRAELLDLMQTKTIAKALMKPLSAQQLMYGIFEISNYQKPKETKNIFALRMPSV